MTSSVLHMRSHRKSTENEGYEACSTSKHTIFLSLKKRKKEPIDGRFFQELSV